MPPVPSSPSPLPSPSDPNSSVGSGQFVDAVNNINNFEYLQSLIQYFIADLLYEIAVPALGYILQDTNEISTKLYDLQSTLQQIESKLSELNSGNSVDLTNVENQLDELIDTQATEQERQMSEGAESLRDGYNAIFTQNDNPIDTKDFMGLGIIAHFFDSFGGGSQLNPVTQAFSGDWWNIWNNLNNSFEEASQYVYDPGG